MKPAPFSFAAPSELDEIVDLLSANGYDAKLLAGGQSLLPMVNLRLARPSVLIDINRAPALTGIAMDEGQVRIGASTRQIEVQRTLAGEVPLVTEALALVGHVATRTRGTVGGSLVHADPAAELPSVLLALGGEVVVSSKRGERVIAAADLFVSTFTTSLEPDEVLTQVRIPIREGERFGFVEFSQRHGDFALAGAAVSAKVDGEGLIEKFSMALLAVSDVPLKLPELETSLVGRKNDPDTRRELAAAVSAAVDPNEDVHASGAYRKRAAGIAASRALAQTANIQRRVS